MLRAAISMPTNYDAIVIGTGQAGPPLAARLASRGQKTAVIERHRFGGTCVNVGCIPTKTMVASARAMHVARRGDEYGFSIGGDVQADMSRVKARKDEVVRQSAEGLEQWMRGQPDITVYLGHARFEGPHTVLVGEERFEAPQIFINVGARAVVPDVPGVGEVPVLTNSTMLDLDVLPEHLVVVGGSYIGLEFAQMYRRFGSRVTVVERSGRLIGREDPDVSETLRHVLEGEGIAFRLDALCIGLHKTSRGVAVGVDCANGAPQIEGSHVLIAVGRRPNTDDLGLDAAGLATDSRGYIVVDDQCRTNVPGVWAVGECNGRGAFTHTAYNDYEVVAANLLDGDPRLIGDRIPCYALFTDPPVGRVGMTAEEARQSGKRVMVGYRPMTRVGRAREMGETQGFMRVLVDGDTERILGAVVFGVGGDEIVHSVLDVMYANAPYTRIARAMHIHPTVTELIPTLLQELAPLE
jgi:pyruvate/2-oxoglutarate dehydrogenase complex dihydrolipoamide dehydrogenase (E3) component